MQVPAIVQVKYLDAPLHYSGPGTVCHSSIVLYISRLSNALPYPHLNNLLGFLAILDTSISYPYNCYLHTYHIPPLLGHWGRIIDVLYDNVGDLLLLHCGPTQYI